MSDAEDDDCPLNAPSLRLYRRTREQCRGPDDARNASIVWLIDTVRTQRAQLKDLAEEVEVLRSMVAGGSQKDRR